MLKKFVSMVLLIFCWDAWCLVSHQQLNDKKNEVIAVLERGLQRNLIPFSKRAMGQHLILKIKRSQFQYPEHDDYYPEIMNMIASLDHFYRLLPPQSSREPLAQLREMLREFARNSDYYIDEIYFED